MAKKPTIAFLVSQYAAKHPNATNEDFYAAFPKVAKATIRGRLSEARKENNVKPRNATFEKRSQAAKKGWVKRKAKESVKSIAQRPKGKGVGTDSGNLSAKLLAKMHAIEDFGIDCEAKESVDGKLIYIVCEVPFNERGLQILRVKPWGFLYRLSAKYSTRLQITKQYKMIMKGKMQKSYRNMGTFKEHSLLENILSKDLELAKEANKVFEADDTATVEALSAIIIDPKHRRKEDAT